MNPHSITTSQTPEETLLLTLFEAGAYIDKWVPISSKQLKAIRHRELFDLDQTASRARLTMRGVKNAFELLRFTGVMKRFPETDAPIDRNRIVAVSPSARYGFRPHLTGPVAREGARF
jgi:hypothetical protein